MRKTKQINVSRALAIANIFHFLWSCSRACLLPFLSLYLRQLGLDAAMTGIVMGTKHLVTLLWSPVSSVLAKRYNVRRLLINSALLCSAAIALLLLVPVTDGNNGATSCGATNQSKGPSNDPPTSSITPETSLSTTHLSLPAYSLPVNTTVHLSLPVSSAASSLPVNTTVHLSLPVSSPASSFPVNTTVHLSLPVSSPASSLPVNTTVHLSLPVSSSTSSLPTSNMTTASVTTSTASHDQHGDDDGLHQRTEDMNISFNSLATPPTINSSATGGRNKRSEVNGEEPSGIDVKVMDPEQQLFFLVLVVVVLWEWASTSVDWTVDDGLFEYLDFADASDRYSSTRPWALLGGGCGVGGAGLLVSQLSCVIVGGAPRSAAHFFCYSGLALVVLPVACCLPLHLNRKRDRANGLLKAVTLVQGSARSLLCALTTLLGGAASSAVDNFLLWQMQDHGGEGLQMGVSLAVALLSQATFPLLASRVSRLLGPGRLLAVATVSLSVQCFYYSFLWSPWAALPAQVLSCLSCGALWWAVNLQCEDMATPGADRSVRRVYGTLCLKLGSSVGSFAGGVVVQRWGLVWLFRGVGGVLLLWSLCLVLLQLKAPRQRINYSRLLAANASEASDSESDQDRDWLVKAMDGYTHQ